MAPGVADGAGLSPGAHRGRGRLSAAVTLGMLPASWMNSALPHVSLATPTPKPGCSLTAAVSGLRSLPPPLLHTEVHSFAVKV